MNVVHEDVEQCVENELQHAVSVFGLHHSNHEKMAVIAEEFEECVDALDELKGMVMKAWARTRENCDSNIMDDVYGRIYDDAVHLATEAIQVAAMAKKEIKTAMLKAAKGTASTGINGQIAYICNACGGHVGRDDSFCRACGAYFGE